MKQLLTICLLAILTLAACSDDGNDVNLTPTATGTVTDSEGNEYSGLDDFQRPKRFARVERRIL